MIKISKTKRNHYFSEHIINNFKEKNMPMKILNCQTKTIKERSSKKSYSGIKLWSQELENSINSNIENKHSIYINYLRKLPINMQNNIIYFYELNDLNQKIIFNKFLLQPILLQLKNKKIKEKLTQNFIESNFESILPVYYLRYNRKKLKNDKFVLPDIINIDIINNLVYFSYPISSYELIVYGNPIRYFLDKYHYPFIYNINVIRNNDKKCEILSSDLKYLEKIKNILDLIEKSYIKMER